MPRLDEYGDIPGQGGGQWATEETALEDHDIHTRGTVRTGRGVQFWMTSGRPPGWSPEAWEEYTQARWNRAFAKKEGAA